MAKNNQVMFMGNLTADPSIREVNGADGKTSKVCNYDIAVHGANDKVSFVRIASWGKQAENDAKYLKKGNFVVVQGEADFGSYEKDGVKIPTFQVKAENVTYMMPASEAKKDAKAMQTFNNDDQFGG